VYRACHRLLKDAHEAEDASQAVFVVLARKAGKLRKGDLSAWLYRVAHHVAAETVRRRMRRTGREDAYAATEAIQAGEFASPAAAAESDVLGLLDTALLNLPERYRQAVILRYLQNHSEKDAAQLASVPLGTLSGRASQGIAMLRQRLAKRGVALSGVALAGLLTSEASAAVPETLLPSILATLRLCSGQAVKTAVATTATATAATSTATMLAKGAMKAMFWNSIKTAAMVAVSVGAIGVGGLAAVQTMAEKAGDKEGPTHQLVTGETFHPIQSAIQDIPLETEDIVRTLGLGYWAFNIPFGADGTHAAVRFSLGWYTKGHAENSYFNDLSFVRDSKDKLLQVRILCTESKTNALCLVDFNRRDSAKYECPARADPRRPTYINRELSMDDKGRVVLAYELPPGCDTPNASLRSADGACRALVLQLRPAAAGAIALHPSRFDQDTSKLDAAQLANLLGLHHTTFCVKKAINWAGTLSCYAEGKRSPGGARFSSLEGRATILFGEQDQAFRVHAASGKSVFGTTVLRNPDIVAKLKESASYRQKEEATEMDEQGRIVLSSSYLTQPSAITPEKSSEALVLQLGTGENGQSPLRRNQVSAEKTSDQDLLHALTSYLDFQPLRIFTLAPQTKPIRCRIARYAGGKFEYTVAETMLDPADLGTPWRFAILQKEEDAKHPRVEGVLLANSITLPFRMDAATPEYLLTPGVGSSSQMTLDSSGRLLLGSLIKLEPKHSGMIDPLPENITIADLPAALVLEFVEK
jgi:RNA polymerase sigma factor (sigma-70 family)